ncbi:thermonuclease family protein [Desulfoprunum benzoelyticum]|uniref:Endonuclease YncB(Thermonuclease family) n=1 Tax=Desulfoprunum benzoelyticum TaxID=1506996 RepID=A0A840V730_9BACT|nr:endonuclease YncB(thermonuclease family) [Desulfoprunum benzoelyticum]MBM9531355.1 thermonuclease family protein [Desulfoprunum benzoelyticum]
MADGDTISVLRGNEKVNIRLYGVDTPEKKQAFGNQAKKFTNAAVRKMSVKIVPFETDKYGRTVAMVYVGDQCLNENLIRDGFAWVYRKYCKEDFCRSWLNLEASAREKGRGLWVDPEPKPPWEWRKDSKKKNDWWGRVVR